MDLLRQVVDLCDGKSNSQRFGRKSLVPSTIHVEHTCGVVGCWVMCLLQQVALCRDNSPSFRAPLLRVGDGVVGVRGGG